MRTRSGRCYPKAVRTKRKADLAAGDRLKRARLSPEIVAGGCDFFDALPDDLVLSVLSKLSFTAGCPADFISVLLTCKRLNRLGLDPVVLHSASVLMVIINVNCWSEYYHRFLKLCADTGNPIVSSYSNMVTCATKLLSLGEEGRICLHEICRKMFADELGRP